MIEGSFCVRVLNVYGELYSIRRGRRFRPYSNGPSDSIYNHLRSTEIEKNVGLPLFSPRNRVKVQEIDRFVNSLLSVTLSR